MGTLLWGHFTQRTLPTCGDCVMDSTYGYTGLHTRLVGIVSLDSTYEYTGLHTRLVGTICTVRKKALFDKSFVHFHLSQEI